jgi:hypothetical protein
MRKLFFILLLLPFFAFPQQVSSPPLEFKDEGVSQGRPVYSIDCVGAGISCSRSGVTGTINAIFDTVSGDNRYLKLGGDNADRDINIGSYNFTTTGIGSFGSLVTTVGGLTLLAGQDIKPSTNSTTALNIAQADGTDFVIFDTTNKKVGIGTTPDAILHVSGLGGAGQPSLFRVDATSSYGGMTFNSAADQNIFIELKEANVKKGGFETIAASDTTYLSSHSGHTLTFGANAAIGSAVHMTLLTNGNFGINEASPQDKLEVNGTGLFKDKLKFTQDDGNEYIDSLNDGYMDYGATTGHRFNTLLTANGNLDILNGATSSGILKIYEDSTDGSNYASFQVPALAGNTVYTLPADDGDAGEQLQTDGSGGLTWEAAGGAGATAWDDVTDPDADTEIAMTGFETLFSSTLDAAGKTVLSISDTDADLANAVSLLDLQYTDDGQANGTFFRCLDNAGADVKFSIGVDGNTTIAGTLNVTGAITGDLTGNASGSSGSCTGNSVTATTASVATTVTLTDNEDTAENNPIVFVANADPDGGNLGLESDGTCYYTPSTGKITATGFVGALTGNADTVTTNANLTGEVTSVGNAATIADSIAVTSWNLTTPTITTSLTTDSKTISETEIGRLDGLTSAIIDDDKIDTFSELDAIVADKALVNKADGAVWLGVHDFGGATSTEIVNGANPTTDAAGEIAIDTSAAPGSGIRFYGDAAYTVAGTYSKSFVILNPVATDDYPLWCSPYAITIKHVRVQDLGGTNIVGQLTECDAEGVNCAVVDDSDITATANNSVDDDGTLSNPSIDALNYVGWKTESVSGASTSVTVTFDYTINQVN